MSATPLATWGRWGARTRSAGCWALLGWENTSGEQEPVTVYVERYRGVLLGAARNEHANQTRRAERARSEQARTTAEARRALLGTLVEAIGGTL